MREEINVMVLLALFCAVLFVSFASAVQPDGATVSAGTPGRAPTVNPGNASAYAGNVTYIGITGSSITQSWQGYFGNVSGTLILANSAGNQMYNWSLAEPSGEVYASMNSSITWSNIQCFNFTANATGSSGSAGGTNIAGTNLTGLESMFNIGGNDVDGVNETFSFTPGGDGHDAFTTAGLSFTAGECLSTKTFDSSGAIGTNNFEEALLYEPTTSSVVFASILEQGTLNGFNSADNDFQMLVLEDGHGVDVTATPYYFFVELQ